MIQASTLSPEMQDVVSALQGCERACLEAVKHGLQTGGPLAESDHIRSLLDCAAVCASGVRMCALASQHVARQLQLCTEVCERTAASCEEHAGDPLLRECADVCHDTAQECRRLT